MSADTFRAFQATTDGERGVVDMSIDELPDDGALVEVQWSSVNYKDGLATRADGKVARISPLIPGIDLAGVVAESADARFEPGDAVLAHGYDIGEADGIVGQRTRDAIKTFQGSAGLPTDGRAGGRVFNALKASAKPPPAK